MAASFAFPGFIWRYLEGDRIKSLSEGLGKGLFAWKEHFLTPVLL